MTIREVILKQTAGNSNSDRPTALRNMLVPRVGCGIPAQTSVCMNVIATDLSACRHRQWLRLTSLLRHIARVQAAQGEELLSRAIPAHAVFDIQVSTLRQGQASETFQLQERQVSDNIIEYLRVVTYCTHGDLNCFSGGIDLTLCEGNQAQHTSGNF